MNEDTKALLIFACVMCLLVITITTAAILAHTHKVDKTLEILK